MMRASFAMLRLVGFGVLSGCTITAVGAEPDAHVQNECAGDQDCGSGSCIDGSCQTPGGELEALLFEVTPPSDSSLSHVQFLTHLEGLPTSGGEQSIALARTSRVAGHFTLAAETDCKPRLFEADETGTRQEFIASLDGSLPVAVSLSPSERLLGFSAQEYLTTTGNQPDPKAGYTFLAAVPAGDYDIYVAPPLDQDPSCPVAPQLYRGQPIGDSEVKLPYTVPQAASLELEVQWPVSGESLDGWTADIIEPRSGRAISSRFVFGAAVAAGSGPGATLNYAVQLAYSAVIGGSPEETDPGSELVRLTPPATVVAPTIFLVRSGLGLLPVGDGKVVIDGFTKVPQAVTLEGQVADGATGKPTQGTVTLVSSSIDGIDSGIFASFQRTVNVEQDGRFLATVPPGKYRVYAVPPTLDRLAAFETSWEVPADIPYQAGKLLELPPVVAVIGTAFDARSRRAMLGARVSVVAAPQIVPPFDQAFGAAAFVPRSGSALVSGSGEFSVETDPGTYDLSIRPPDSSGFAWFVRPSVRVDGPVQDVGSLPLPFPVVLTGSATVPGTDKTTVPIPSALIRAYAYLDENHAYTAQRSKAASVIQVGETRADESGAYRLLLPPSISSVRP